MIVVVVVIIINGTAESVTFPFCRGHWEDQRGEFIFLGYTAGLWKSWHLNHGLRDSSVSHCGTLASL